MPNKHELSRAYQAGYNCIVFGPNTKNCHYTHFASPELTKTWELGSQDATLKQLVDVESLTVSEEKISK